MKLTLKMAYLTLALIPTFTACKKDESDEYITRRQTQTLTLKATVSDSSIEVLEDATSQLTAVDGVEPAETLDPESLKLSEFCTVHAAKGIYSIEKLGDGESVIRLKNTGESESYLNEMMLGKKADSPNTYLVVTTPSVPAAETIGSDEEVSSYLADKFIIDSTAGTITITHDCEYRRVIRH